MEEPAEEREHGLRGTENSGYRKPSIEVLLAQRSPVFCTTKTRASLTCGEDPLNPTDLLPRHISGHSFSL